MNVLCHLWDMLLSYLKDSWQDNINVHSLHFCSNSKHYPYNDICSTSLKHFYPCTGLIFPNTAALLSVFWKRALMRPLTSCAVNSWAKGPWGKYRYKSCFSIKWSFWQEQIPLEKRSWQLPFRLPIYPRCLVNWLLKLQSTPYSESSVVQQCRCPEMQTQCSSVIMVLMESQHTFKGFETFSDKLRLSVHTCRNSYPSIFSWFWICFLSVLEYFRAALFKYGK